MRSFHSFSKSTSGLISTSLLLALSTSVLAQETIQECLSEKNLPTVTAQDATWESVTSPWSLRYNPEPAAVITPAKVEDIAAALECAVQFETKVTARNGGHSYGAYGLGGTHDGALVIDMQSFTKTTYDEATQLYTMGGGARVGEAVTWLWENHGRHFPHVRANRVGVAGSSIGAGFGTTTRHLGTPMDFLENVEYMLYNGTIVTASRTENPDLFWVAQGAGSSYGIILSLTTKTWEPEHTHVTAFDLALGNITIEEGVNALLAVQDYGLTTAPDTLSLRWALATPWAGSGYFYGAPEDFNATIAPLLKRLPATTTLKTNVQDFWTMEQIITPSINGTTETFPPRSMYLQALVLRSDQPFTYESAFVLYNNTIFSFDRTDLTPFGFVDLWGGVSKDIKDEDTSYAHANSLWIIRWEGRLASGLTEWPADAIEYMQAGLQPFEKQLESEGVPLRGFVNYRDTELSEEQWSERLYGQNFERMMQIKTDIDPMGIFTTNSQSIPSS